MSQERKKKSPRELICPFLLSAMILAGKNIWKSNDVRTSDELEGEIKQAKRKLTEEVKVQCACLGEDCAMWNTYGTACGLRTR